MTRVIVVVLKATELHGQRSCGPQRGAWQFGLGSIPIGANEANPLLFSEKREAH